MDTVSLLVNSKVFQRQSGAISLQPWCLSFIDEVEKQLRNIPKPDFVFGYPFSAQIRKPGAPRPAFLAISYEAVFDGTRNAVRSAAKKTNFKCEITGDLATPGNIMDQVWQGIRGADVVIADITGSNPNVMLEIGLATALGKEVIVITQEKDLPFDVRHWRKVAYAADRLSELETNLIASFQAVSARYPFEGPEPKF